MTVPPRLPVPYDGQMPATTVAEFMWLLREIRRRANLTAGQIALYSDGTLPRSTAYNFVSDKNPRLPKNRGQVEAFCRACKLGEEQTSAILRNWAALSAAPGAAMVADAELVPLVATDHSEDRASPHAGGPPGSVTIAATPPGSVTIAGNLSGDVNINNYTVAHPTRSRLLHSSKPRLGILLLVAVLVVAPVTVWWWSRSATPSSCPTNPTTDFVSVEALNGDCVGYSGDDPDDPASGHQGYVFARTEPDSQRLTTAQKLVYQQNREAETISAEQPQRPLLVLVYFGQLSGVPFGYTAESEDLEGLALAQHHNNTELGNLPLIKVLVANTGPNLVDGLQVVSMLEPLIQHHKEIVGAVIDQSRRATVPMIHRLTALGVPVVGPSLSADRLQTVSPMYFQISPPDIAIATMIARYLDTQPGDKKVRIYDKPDLAVDDLNTADTASDLANVLARTGRRFVDISHWNDADAFIRDGTSICTTDILYYAGRGEDFPDFLDALDIACNHQQVTLIADDSVNTFIDNAAARHSFDPTQSLIYVTKASLTTCQNHGMGSPNPNGQDFYGQANDYLDACGANMLHPLGDRVALSYDAVTLLTLAEQWLMFSTAAIPITAGTIWAALLQLPQPIALASGTLRFPSATPAGQAKVDPEKWGGLMRVDNIANGTPTLIYGCGSVTTDDNPSSCRSFP